MNQHPDLIAMVANQRNAERLQGAELARRRERPHTSEQRHGAGRPAHALIRLVPRRAAHSTSAPRAAALGRAA